jgi:hypothetical protein
MYGQINGRSHKEITPPVPEPQPAGKCKYKPGVKDKGHKEGFGRER